MVNSFVARIKLQVAVDIQGNGRICPAMMVNVHEALFENPKLAADLIVYLTTSPDIWSKLSNWPAYKPIMALWQKQVSSNALFAKAQKLVHGQ